MGPDLERRLNRGIARLQEHSLNHADADLRHVLSDHAGHPAVLHFLGVTACKLGRIEEGISLLRQSVTVEPGRVLGWLDLAVSLRNAGRVSDALSAYKRATDLVSAPA